tara:strand:- start:2263 stop:3366 length:1104 start_codon:yes stop_codon:yes gene_type:complete
MIEEVIRKINGKYFVFSEGGKRLGGPFASKGEASKRLGQIEHFKSESIVWEVSNLNLDIIESEGKPKSLKMTGTALTTGTSRNKVKYTYKNLEEVNGSMFNFLVGHRKDYDNPDHNVGEGSYNVQGEKLKFEGLISNNKHHPDIVEQAQKELVSVSVQGGFKSIEKVDGEVIVEGLRVPILALVNKHTRGVEGATIESAIAERIELDGVDEKEDMEANMAEENAQKILEKQLKEKDDKITAIEEKHKVAQEEIGKLKKKSADELAGKKKKVAESIVKINEKMDKDKLMDKSLSELQTIEEYEKKISESDGDENEGGDAEVDDKDDAEEKDDKLSLKGIVIEKETGYITMDEGMRKKFNDEVRESIYR